MYEMFEKLLEERGVTAYRVAKETGISTATLSDWKSGRSTPKTDKMQKIADYFGVSIDYLLGTEKKEPTEKSGGLSLEAYRAVQKEMEEANKYRVPIVAKGGEKQEIIELTPEEYEAIKILLGRK